MAQRATLEFPFSITIHGRKAAPNIPVRTLTSALNVVQDEGLAYFNTIDLREAELGDILETDDYSVVIDKRRRIWAEDARTAFRIQIFLKFQFRNSGNSERIREHLAEFFHALQAILRFDSGRILDEIISLDDGAIFSQRGRDYRLEADMPDPWANTYAPNIRARTAERTMAKVYELPQNVIREISSYVGTRRRESAPRLRPLPPALRNVAIREAGNLRPSKGAPEVRAASPVRAQSKRNKRSWFKRFFTRKVRGEN